MTCVPAPTTLTWRNDGSDLDTVTGVVLGAVALALPIATLIWWRNFGPVGDDLGDTLDAMQPAPLADTPPTDRYARFEQQDYSGDRGTVPVEPPAGWLPSVVMPVIYEQVCKRLGWRP